MSFHSENIQNNTTYQYGYIKNEKLTTCRGRIHTNLRVMNNVKEKGKEMELMISFANHVSETAKYVSSTLISPLKFRFSYPTTYPIFALGCLV